MSCHFERDGGLLFLGGDQWPFSEGGIYLHYSPFSLVGNGVSFLRGKSFLAKRDWQPCKWHIAAVGLGLWKSEPWRSTMSWRWLVAIGTSSFGVSRKSCQSLCDFHFGESDPFFCLSKIISIGADSLWRSTEFIRIS